MAVIHVVSHTHWDREWYLTFQQFRIKLVRLIDNLLEILKDNQDYRSFLLDGQTIILRDYFEIRPEREQELKNYINAGRLFTGPWYCLPDEFLVSPEALIRNLLAGRQDADEYGACMNIGYLPDQFGHIGQLPQILSGFGMRAVVAWRGIGDQPCELCWQAPDGSSVLLAHLRETYSNAVKIPGLNNETTVSEALRQVSKLEPFSHSGHILLMNGTDHIEARNAISGAITLLNSSLPQHNFIHSNLPAYVGAVLSSLKGNTKSLPVIKGEMRSSRCQPLLSGTLSTHVWVKQRNHACETLLAKWAEPLSAYASLIKSRDRQTNLQPVIKHAWRLLMQCHPHDSICASAIDQVLDEMKTRFDQVEQIGSEATRISLENLADNINTQCPDYGRPQAFAITVFNPTCVSATGAVEIPLILESADTWVEISDENGQIIPCQLIKHGPKYNLMNKKVDWNGLASLADSAMEGSTHGIMVHNVILKRNGTELDMSFIMDDTGSPMLKHWEEEAGQYLADTSLKAFNVTAVLVRPSTIRFTAVDVPGNGYRTFWLRKTEKAAPSVKRGNSHSIENEFFKLDAETTCGVLKLTDKRTGAIYSDLNRFTDGGDCGDVYNYCPPEDDRQVDSRCDAIVKSISILKGEVSQSLEVQLELPVPASLLANRRSRSRTTKRICIVTRATVTDGIDRVDISTDIDNACSDHRLRVHFGAPFSVDTAEYDGHFEVVSRPLTLPEFDDTWSEQPLPTHPQRDFTSISDGRTGLTVASRGLREAEALNNGKGSEIALTLLRCVGWLSLDNLSTRTGHAGPPFITTPAAQMHGKHRFEYSIIPHKGAWQNSFRQAGIFNTPLKAVLSLPHPGALPGTGAFIISAPGSFVISSTKIAEDSNGLIVRGYNITSKEIDVCVKPLFTFTSAQKVRLDETRTADVSLSADGMARLKAAAHEIVTLKFIK